MDVGLSPASLNVSFRDSSSEYEQLRKAVDKVLYDDWIYPASETINQYYERTSDIMLHLSKLKTEACDLESCNQYMQCLSSPILACKEFKIVEKCS